MLLAWAPGCAKPHPPAAKDDWAALRQVWYKASDLEFSRADFWKPDEARRSDDVFGLAPLLVCELGAADDAPAIAPPVRFKSDGSLEFTIGAATVYWSESRAKLQGAEHRQVSFVWWPGRGGAYIHADASAEHWHGVRMTFDAEGFPIIWEALAADMTVAPIFVARSLEERTATELGNPLEGRRFPVETDVASNPRVVVPRVIDDGPMPMGPMVYLPSEERRPGTMICRCMPSQVDRIAATGYYDLKPLSDVADLTISELLERAADRAPTDDDASQLRRLTDPAWLSEALRLPDGN